VKERSILNGANKRAAEAIEDIRVSLPFPLIRGYYDNGIEFVNSHFWSVALPGISR
jgi:hypothetical protein